ncbi:MAG: hypothetical protein COA47_08185 [Robiginitomaculum sp.]|nr:MAG: hypothetical protein COA47_08185 [Robiginitomaculum sp.]
MIKMTIIELFFLGLPFAIFIAYRTFLVRHKKMDGDGYSPVPYHKLFVIGGLLSLLVFVFLAFSNEKITDQKYVPAHMESGELIPGGFVDREPN